MFCCFYNVIFPYRVHFGFMQLLECIIPINLARLFHLDKMIIRKYHIIMNPQEIARRLREVASNVSDRLIHTAPRSVSLVCLADAFAPQHSKQVCSAFGCQSIHYTFRNDGWEPTKQNEPIKERVV